MTAIEERRMLEALREKDFDFIDSVKLDAKIATMSGTTSDGDLTAKKADIQAQIRAGNPS